MMTDDPESSDASLTLKLDSAFRLAEKRSGDDASVLRLLREVAHAADAMSIISANDLKDDISTPSLRLFLIPSLQAELETCARIESQTDRLQLRKSHVQAAIGAARVFFTIARKHEILPTSLTRLLQPYLNPETPSKMLSPAEKRMNKIQQYKLEKAVQAQLTVFRDAYRSRKAPKSTQEAPSNVYYDLLVIQTKIKTNASDPALDGDDDGGDDDDDDDDGTDLDRVVTPSYEVLPVSGLRGYLCLLIVLHALRTANTIESATQELELLSHAPPPSLTDAHGHSAEPDKTWRLDTGWTSASAANGPLLSETGRPLRPFTITASSTATKREQLASEVFRPSHRLPTMSIDEYLEEEARRGNIIQGGGHSQSQQPTPREQRAERAENDGTRDAEDAEEEARQEAIYWDSFKESHRRGEGNTMNRG